MKYAIILLIIVLSLIHINTFAFQAVEPSVKTYESKNGKYRLTVTPGDVQNYFYSHRQKVKTKPVYVEGSKDQCIGVLEKKADNGFAQLWEKELDNDVAPLSAIVSDTGKYVVTFDNWHSGGQGDNVVVIYNEKGDLLKKFALEDIASRTEIIRMNTTFPAFMIFWGKDHELDEENDLLILNLSLNPFPYPAHAPGREQKSTPERDNRVQSKTLRRIRLSDGYLIDVPLIEKELEYPEFACEEGQKAYPIYRYGRLFQLCVIDNKNNDIEQEVIPDGKYQISTFIDGAWFIEVRGQYINGKKHGTWTQVFNEGDTPCIREYDLDAIVKEECPQGWWGVF